MKPECHVLVPDTHFPFQDQPLVNECLDFIQEVKPKGVHLIGDLMDCYPLSRFDKNPRRKHTIQDELDEAGEFLDGEVGVRDKYVAFGFHFVTSILGPPSIL